MEYDPSIDIAEDPEVYPPSDDSILLIESLDVVPGEKVLEVGCGSGVVSIHCAKNGCDVTAVDVNPRAVELARRNAGANGADIPVCESDVYGNVDDVFDTIVFNLPPGGRGGPAGEGLVRGTGRTGTAPETAGGSARPSGARGQGRGCRILSNGTQGPRGGPGRV